MSSQMDVTFVGVENDPPARDGGGFSMRKYVADRRERWIDYITGVIVGRPCCMLAGAAAFFVVAMALVVAVGTKQTQPSEYEWELPYDKFSERRDMLDDASDNVDAGLLPTRSDETFDWYFFYDAKPKFGKNTCDGPSGVLATRTVQAMCEAEREFWGRRKYEEQYCVLTDGVCLVPEDSLARIMYEVPSGTPLQNASSSFWNCDLLEQSRIDAIWDDMYSNFDSYEFYFDDEAYDRGYPCRGRSLMFIGTPLDGYSKTSDWNDAQFRKIEKRFVNRVQSDLVSRYNMKAKPLRSVYLEEARAGESGKKVEVLWWNPFLEDAQFVEAVNSDFMFAIASVVFVWVWICVHTGSLFIGSMSMLQILLSLPISLFWYRVVLQIRYIAIMIQLAIFVILGIGADDVFVYNDAWRQSVDAVEAQKPGEDRNAYLQRRVKYAYTRAFQSIFNTSFTTAVAFFATSIAELVPIAAFGIFSAICVIMNFALVLTVTPCIVLIHHKWCVDRCGKGDHLAIDSSNRGKKGDLEEENKDNDGPGPTATSAKEAAAAEEPAGTTTTAAAGAAKRGGRWCCRGSACNEHSWVRVYLSLIMCGRENRLEVIDAALHPEARLAPEKVDDDEVPTVRNSTRLLKKPVALILVLTFGAYGATSAYLASRLEPPSEQEKWFAGRHMATKVDRLSDSGYGANDASYYTLMSFVWGMDRIKRGRAFDPWVPHRARGEVRYSNNPIDLSGDAAQVQILSACDNVETYNCESGCVGETLARPNSTVCFLREFQSWHQTTYGTSTYGLDEPVFTDRLSTFRTETTPESDDYSSWEDLIGFVDGELRFVRIDTRLSMGLEDPITDKKMVLRRTNKFLSRFCRQIDGTGLPDVWQFSYTWAWYKTQRALIRGLLIGMSIAFPIAFLTLVGATQNVILALYAIITIGSIVSSVLGLAWMLGWALGIKESVAGVIVIGLAVDYTIHLGHMYDHARFEQDITCREDKFIFAMVSMGPTIFAGAVTTAGAAIFLLACQLTFFTQMGILIISTIGYSLVFSLFFYMPLLYVAGPEGDAGNLSSIKHAVLNFCSRKSSCCAKTETREVEA